MANVNQVSFTSAPTDFDVERKSAERQRKLAEMLQKQSMQQSPDNEMAGGYVVKKSPLNGVAKMLQAFTASQMMRGADEKDRDVSARRREQLASWVGGIPQAKTETTQTPFDMASVGQDMPGEEPIPGLANEQTTTKQPTKQQMLAWALQGVSSGDPTAAAIAGPIMKDAMTPPKPVVVGRSLLDPNTGQPIGVDQTWQQEQEATRQQRATEAQALREQRMQELQMRLQDQRLNAQERANVQRELAQMQIQGRQDMVRLAASMRPPRQEPQHQIVQTADGPVQVDRTGNARPVMVNGQPARSPKVDKPINEFQGKASLYGTRAAQSDKVLKDLEEKISVAGLATKQAASRMPIVGGVLGAAGNVMLSKDQQRVEQAQRDFVNAVLRQESGAVIAETEFENGKKQYFPAPGDTPDVIKQKRENRQLAIRGFERMAGPGAEDIRTIREAPLIPGRRAGDKPKFLGFE